MPDRGDLGYIIDWVFEAGPSVQGGMGPAPLDWQTIHHWKSLMGLDLEPKESFAIRHLSSCFVDQQIKSKDAKCPPPWVDPEQMDRMKVADKVTETFKAIAKRRKEKRGRRSTTANRS